jgi:hypothetical protein
MPGKIIYARNHATISDDHRTQSRHHSNVIVGRTQRPAEAL